MSRNLPPNANEAGLIPISDLMFYQLSGWSHLSETVAAVNGFVTARLEGNFGGFAALGAGSGEHLAFGAIAAAETFAFPRLTTLGAPLRFIGITFAREELLVLGTVNEGSATISTREGFVLKSHADDLLSYRLVRVWVIQCLREIRWRGFREACNNLNTNNLIIQHKSSVCKYNLRRAKCFLFFKRF